MPATRRFHTTAACLLAMSVCLARAQPAAGDDPPPPAAVSSIAPEELEGFEHYAPQIQQLVRDALALTKLNLTYTFGSAKPRQGGMDCSGTIYYLLNELGLKDVPRQSDQICAWVQKNTLLHRTVTVDSHTHPELAALRPGDLLFWSGTHEASKREIPVTHVMLYLGKLKKTGKPIVFGASDGRSYQSQRRTGVSVFDFAIPSAASKSKLYGYGLIPGAGRIKVEAPKPPQTIVTAPSKVVPEKADAAAANEANRIETVRRAIVATESSTVTKATPSSPPSAAKTTPKPSPQVKKTAPPPPTVQEQLNQAAQELGDSLRKVFSR